VITRPRVAPAVRSNGAITSRARERAARRLSLAVSLPDRHDGLSQLARDELARDWPSWVTASWT
jgi:hypothetical protein